MGAGGGIAGIGLGGFQMLEAKNQADALRRSAEFDANQLEFNAQLTGMQMNEIERQSKIDITERESQVSQMLGAQKVNLAAQGISLDSEVAGLIEDEERRIGRKDVQTIKNNAWRESMGLEIEKSDLRNKATSTRMAGKENARSTIAAGGLNAASSVMSGFSKF